MTDVKNQQRIKSLHRAILFISGMALLAVSILPIWRIELIAPQYPEGLEMYIYSYKLGGQVDVINGLNHYIGMKVLKADDFIEFTVLPYIIGIYGLFFILAGVVGRRKLMYVLLGAFILFGVVAMVDFYKWLYDYGHNLDPTAPIIVPGMAYQPPLIGYKQLLNFLAFSIPDIGGWIFIGCGVLLAYCCVSEWLSTRKKTLQI
jgi:copper chaperone NosL